MLDQLSPLLSNPAAAAFLGAIVGGILSFISTFYFNNRQRNIQSERLRRALATEIKCLEITQLRIAVRTMQSQGLLQQVIEDQLFSMTEEKFGEIPEGGRENAQDVLNDLSRDIIHQAAPEAFEKVELFLATPIYESNTNKIELLDSDEIEQLVNFYRLLDVTRDEINRVIETANSSDDSRLQSRLHTLENDLKELESMREDVLDSLGADTEELQHSEELLSKDSESDEDAGSETSEDPESDEDNDSETTADPENDEESDFETETAG